MFCGKCGAELPEGDRFCRKCGNAIKADVETGESAVKKSAETTKSKPRVFFAIVLIMIIIGVLFLVGFIILKYQKTNQIEEVTEATTEQKITEEPKTEATTEEIDLETSFDPKEIPNWCDIGEIAARDNTIVFVTSNDPFEKSVDVFMYDSAGYLNEWWAYYYFYDKNNLETYVSELDENEEYYVYDCILKVNVSYLIDWRVYPMTYDGMLRYFKDAQEILELKFADLSLEKSVRDIHLDKETITIFGEAAINYSLADENNYFKLFTLNESEGSYGGYEATGMYNLSDSDELNYLYMSGNEGNVYFYSSKPNENPLLRWGADPDHVIANVYDDYFEIVE